MEKVYACIDLKSFYASVECAERKLNPLTTNLVVADISRTEKTICLAVSPSLKKYGLKGRARLYEVISKIDEINKERKRNNKKDFISRSFNDNIIKTNPLVEVDYIIAKPRMSLYIKYSSEIYQVYLSFLSKDDIYVYSIDEIFCDLTNYLNLYQMTPEELVSKMITAVYKKTGITATGGIGNNLYLAKVAMDIMAKHVKPNSNGVRIASLDTKKYRKLLWNHQPLTDFWRVGQGYIKTLQENKIYTMGDICLTSIKDEDKLFKLFGINAELLIDHAWGFEPCTLSDVKNYEPDNNSLSSAQVLHEAYDKSKARIIAREMVYNLTLQMISKNYVTNAIMLTIGYDVDNLNNGYIGIIKKDYYGRNIPKEAHSSRKINHFTSSNRVIEETTISLFNEITDNKLTIRRIGIAFLNLKKKDEVDNLKTNIQLDLFNHQAIDLEKEKKDEDVQKAVLRIKNKYGKNALLRGIDLLDGATTIERNNEIGGHKA